MVKSYKIYEYMKDKPQTLISIVTAIVAVSSFIVNWLVWLTNAMWVKHLGFNVRIASTDNLFYTLLIGFILGISEIVISGVLGEYTQKWTELSVYGIIASGLIKRCEKEVNVINKEINIFGKRIKHNDLSYKGRALEERVRENEKRIASIREKFKTTKKRLLIVAVDAVKSLLALEGSSFFIRFAGLLCVFSLSISPMQWRKSVIYSFIASLFLLLIRLIMVFSYKSTIERHNKKLLSKENEAIDIIDLYIGKMNDTVTQIRDQKKMGWKSIVCDENIIYMVKSIGTYFLYMFMAITVLFNIFLSQNKEFNITYIDGEEYIIACQKDDIYYLDRIHPEGDELYIFINEHRILKSQDMSYTKETFKTIQIEEQ